MRSYLRHDSDLSEYRYPGGSTEFLRSFRFSAVIRFSFMSPFSWCQWFRGPLPCPLGTAAAGGGRGSGSRRDRRIDIDRVKVEAMLLSGLFCGLGGAYLSLAYVTLFSKEMTHERGFIALAAIFFARGNPYFTALVALLFGAATALSVTLPYYPLASPRNCFRMIPLCGDHTGPGAGRVAFDPGAQQARGVALHLTQYSALVYLLGRARYKLTCNETLWAPATGLRPARGRQNEPAAHARARRRWPLHRRRGPACACPASGAHPSSSLDSYEQVQGGPGHRGHQSSPPTSNPALARPPPSNDFRHRHRRKPVGPTSRRGREWFSC